MSGATTEKRVLGAAEAARRARLASRKLAVLSVAARNAALETAAARIEENRERILAANADDLGAAEEFVSAGRMSQALFARLRVGENGTREMAEKVRGVLKLPDPLGPKLAVTELDD